MVPDLFLEAAVDGAISVDTHRFILFKSDYNRAMLCVGDKLNDLNSARMRVVGVEFYADRGEAGCGVIELGAADSSRYFNSISNIHCRLVFLTISSPLEIPAGAFAVSTGCGRRTVL